MDDRHAVIEHVVPAQDVAAGLLEQLRDLSARAAHFRSCNLTPHAIDEAALALDDEHPRTALRHDGGQRRAADATADRDQVVRLAHARAATSIPAR